MVLDITSSISPISPESDYSEPQTSTAVHSKNFSSMSTTTLQTTTTLHDTPYEPLLPPITQNSRESYEARSRRSRSSPILTLPRWSLPRVPSTLNEKDEFGIRKEPLKGHSQVFSRRKAVKLRWSRRSLELIMLIWAIYSTGRYLKAFTLYDGFTSQLVSLALGASTGLSFAFTCCSIALSLVQTRLLFHGFSVTALLSIRSALQNLSSVFFLGPSIANIILLIVWRSSQDSEIQITHRCNLEVDLVWSVNVLCNHPPHAWGIWIALAVVRTALSALVVIIFHRIASSQVIFLSNPPSIKAKHSHIRLESDAETLHSRTGPVVVPRLDRDSPGLLPIPQQATETSSLSNKSSPRNRLRTNQSKSSVALSVNRVRQDETDEAPAYESREFLPMGALTTSKSNPGLSGTFMERFRTLISQIATETEQGLAFARSDSASASSLLSHDEATVSPSTSLPELDGDLMMKYQPQYSSYPQYDPVGDEDDFYSPSNGNHASNGYFPPMEQVAPHYSQLHQEYPQEEHVPMMNGFVRKMPTIDSMGSRERDLMSLGSGARNSLGASSLGAPTPNFDHRRQSPLSTPDSTGPRSRSPTKNTLSSWNDAADTSMDLADALGTIDFSTGNERRKSLTAQAELLVGLSENEGVIKGTSEVGELPTQGETIRMVGGGNSGVVDDDFAMDSLKKKLGGFNQDLDLVLGLGFGSSTEYESSTSGSKESKESAGSMQTFHTAKSVG
ncbi:hypothetical protein CPB83DRAFT_858037 [Crepidotus variabilis]|uniref:Transmembrane protein n=1 Tax=Crepidotus variabilis TaxID=179855 RepID=A0A9P6EC73_9AGAR|nr:hypothetical protein CPB83DRAFT_858037 [Crepidotus variabilis]